MPITQAQKNKILRVINVFETGKPDGVYDAISIYKDGPTVNGEKIRQITYGRSQTTEYGNLKRLIELYLDRGGVLANAFRPYLPKIGGKNKSLHTDLAFKQLLKRAAKEDEIMRNAQDEMFDIYYYQPALIWFEGNKFADPLSLLVIYDSHIHSGSIPDFLRKRFSERTPRNGGDGRRWIEQYTNARHDWLRTHTNTILQKTIYRTKCFKDQMAGGNWDLVKPVNANGISIA
jgi:chitosanase